MASLIRYYQRLANAPDEVQLDGNGVQMRPTLEKRARIEPEAGDAAIFAPGVVQRGTWDRFPAILMTAVVTAVAVLPLALIGDVPGTEILRPMAVVILGGLVTSTLFSLFCIPAMYLLFTPNRAADLDDLAVSLIGEQELRESFATARPSEKESHPTKVNI